MNDTPPEWRKELEPRGLKDVLLSRLFQFRGLPLIFLSAPILYGCLTSEGIEALDWILGSLICACAVALRLLAMREIGKRARVQICNPRQLVCTGPFAYTRNPLYVANISVVTGLATIAGCQWYSLGVFFIGILCYWPVMKYEEEMLEAKLGQDYLEYKKQVPLCLPWRGAFKGPSEVDTTPWSEVLRREKGLIPGALAASLGILALRAYNTEVKEILDRYVISEKYLPPAIAVILVAIAVIYCVSSEQKFRRHRERKLKQELEAKAPSQQPSTPS